MSLVHRYRAVASALRYVLCYSGPLHLVGGPLTGPLPGCLIRCRVTAVSWRASPCALANIIGVARCLLGFVLPYLPGQVQDPIALSGHTVLLVLLRCCSKTRLCCRSCLAFAAQDLAKGPADLMRAECPKILVESNGASEINAKVLLTQVESPVRCLGAISH